MKFVIQLVFVVSPILLSACSNTWEGFKQDASETGQAIGEAAEKAGKSIKEASE